MSSHGCSTRPHNWVLKTALSSEPTPSRRVEVGPGRSTLAPGCRKPVFQTQELCLLHFGFVCVCDYNFDQSKVHCVAEPVPGTCDLVSLKGAFVRGLVFGHGRAAGSLSCKVLSLLSWAPGCTSPLVPTVTLASSLFPLPSILLMFGSLVS